MHLLVLSAFRPASASTGIFGNNVSMHLLVLSAFRLGGVSRSVLSLCVSMHLLVLSAFRLYEFDVRGLLRRKSQCTFWCSVLSD